MYILFQDSANIPLVTRSQDETPSHNINYKHETELQINDVNLSDEDSPTKDDTLVSRRVPIPCAAESQLTDRSLLCHDNQAVELSEDGNFNDRLFGSSRHQCLLISDNINEPQRISSQGNFCTNDDQTVHISDDEDIPETPHIPCKIGDMDTIELSDDESNILRTATELDSRSHNTSACIFSCQECGEMFLEEANMIEHRDQTHKASGMNIVTHWQLIRTFSLER